MNRRSRTLSPVEPPLAETRRLRWQLVRGSGLTSALIAYRADGLSHIDVITPAGKLRGAQQAPCGGQPAGYYDRPPFYAPWTRRLVLELEVTLEQYDWYWSFSERQIGRGYDNPGIWAFITGRYPRRRRFHDPQLWLQPGMRWFCSEEVAANAVYARVVRLPYEDVNHIDPGDVALLLGGAGARVVCDLTGERANDRTLW